MQPLLAAPKHALQLVASAAAPAAPALTRKGRRPASWTEADSQQQPPPVSASLGSHDPKGVHHSGHAKICDFYDAAVIH